MDPELIFLLLIIFGPAIAQWLGLGKKKGPTGKKLPPVETRQRPRTRSSPSRPPERQERSGAAPRTGTASVDRPWWEAEPEEAASPSPAASRPQGAASEAPSWWEEPEDVAAGRATDERSSADPWRDDPHRPSGPVLKTPEDLWEILTGQKAPFPVPEPAERRAEPEPPAFPQDDPRSPRPVPAGDADVISLEGESLEATEISSEARHEEFHRLIDRPRRVIRRRSALQRLGLERSGDVRRAVVLAEVLGKPRGLTPPDW